MVSYRGRVQPGLRRYVLVFETRGLLEESAKAIAELRTCLPDDAMRMFQTRQSAVFGFTANCHSLELYGLLREAMAPFADWFFVEANREWACGNERGAASQFLRRHCSPRSWEDLSAPTPKT